MNIHEPQFIQLRKYHDDRGWFQETHNQILFSDEIFCQHNVSKSRKYVMRGLHFQMHTPQAKLVTVLNGSIVDVIVNIDRTSDQYGNVIQYILSDQNNGQLWVPGHYAHGFVALADDTIVSYKTTAPYDPNDQWAINCWDSDLNIEWPIEYEQRIMSPGDHNAMPWSDLGACLDLSCQPHKDIV